ncbi:hypothetical protein [Cumulibacter soli]|uniref:phage terminase small subunit n=1 Tax=Cumulibacter soli TaxID=2546344 RepID=UPI001067F9D2|nr:hypothetical protein [Cumulibacter soli]
MGTRGPAPKRSTQRRRRNKPEGPQSEGVASIDVEMPDPDEDWHPIAAAWYRSLRASGQSDFYEPSDWAMAYLMAESISRDLNPQFVGFRQVDKFTTEAVKETIPMKGASLSAYLKAMSNLLVSEADRRRAGVELSKPTTDEDEDASVAMLDEYRDALA